MHNLIRVMALNAEEIHRVVFVRAREEGGINAIYDPTLLSETYQVFIHNPLPLKTQSHWEFPSFEKARSFAAKMFDTDWEMLSWDQKAQRPCETGEHECGSGSCETCSTTGGGCSTCGVNE